MNLELALVAGALALGAASQAITGVGLGLVSGAILTLILGRVTTVPLLAMLSIVTLLPVLIRNWSAARWRDAVLLVVPAVALTGPFVFLFAVVDPQLIARISGFCIVVAAVLLALHVRVRVLKGKIGAVAASTLSSALNVAAGTGAPPVALYAVNAGWSAPALRGTLQVFFLAIGVTVLLMMPTSFPNPWAPVLYALAVVAGTLMGIVLGDRIPKNAARLGALTISAAGGLVLLFS